MRSSALYISSRIRTDLPTLWSRTQTPAEHVRWDARFTRIDPLPSADPAAPRSFRYAVRLAPGVVIDGVGHQGGELAVADGSATSTLVFASDHPLSLLRRGSGYWRYRATGDQVTFTTGYDYDVRWGRFGTIADHVWRPCMSRMTAWSFDRLRLWLERDIPPALGVPLTVASLAGIAVAAAGVAHRSPVALALGTAAWLGLQPFTPKARRCTRRPDATPQAAVTL